MEKKTFTPRFEFRIFGNDFQVFTRLLHDLFPKSGIIKTTTSDEIYLISKKDSDFNIKIRDNSLDIKKLIKKEDSLEQWEPFFKTEFPVTSKVLQEKLFPLLQIELFSLDQESYTQEQLLAFLQNYPSINIVTLHKNRTQYSIEEVSFELADIEIKEKKLYTICVESTNKEKLQKFLKRLNIDTLPNTNYIED